MNIFVGRVPEQKKIVISLVDSAGKGYQGLMTVEQVDVLIERLQEHRDALLNPEAAEEASKIVLKKAMRKDK